MEFKEEKVDSDQLLSCSPSSLNVIHTRLLSTTTTTPSPKLDVSETQKEDQQFVSGEVNIASGFLDQEEGEEEEYVEEQIQKELWAQEVNEEGNLLNNNENNKPKENNTDRDIHDPLWWSPLDPEDLGRVGVDGAVHDFLFTNEELAEALSFIHIKDNTSSVDQTFLHEQSVANSFWTADNTNNVLEEENIFLEELNLNDLEFRDSGNGDGDSQLLPSLNEEDFERIFDDNDIDLQSSVLAAVNDSTNNHPKTIEFLDQFQGLSLSLPTQKDDSSADIPPLLDILQQPSSDIFSKGDLLEDDDIPEFLYCRPCGSDFPLQSDGDFAERFFALQPLETAENDPQYLTDIDNLLAQLNLAQEDDNLVSAAEDKDNPSMEPASEQEGEQLRPNPEPPVFAPNVLAAAQPWLDTFGVKISTNCRPEPPTTALREIRAERPCLGHRERILNVEFSPNGTFMASASADSTIRIWRSSTNQLLSTHRHHNQKYECLRVAWASPQWWGRDVEADPQQQDEHSLLATGGADGQVFVLKKNTQEQSSGDDDWEIMACMDHSQGMRHFKPSDDDDRPQIYALQFVDNWQVVVGNTDNGNNSVLLTSSDNHVHIWELLQEPKQEKIEFIEEMTDEGQETQQQVSKKYPWHFREIFSIGFGDLHSWGYGVSVGRVTEQADPHLQYTETTNLGVGAFGGERNPNGVIFVFDAAYCATNGLLGVALSDGSLRLLNGRGLCLSVLQLPGVTTHLTSFCWDVSGTQLATSVASTGHVITWEILLNDSKTDVRKTSCRAVLEGGHDKTVFGARFVGSKTGSGDPLLLSWGVDGRVVLWDAQAVGDVDAPIATLINNPKYAIYGLDLHESSRYMAMVGGTGDGGFIGIPVLLYDICPESREKTPNIRPEKNASEEDCKKPKLDD